MKFKQKKHIRYNIFYLQLKYINVDFKSILFFVI